VYQPENRHPDILSRKCLRSLSNGGSPKLAWDTFEHRDRVELDLDMEGMGPPGGKLSTSKLIELVLFLPRIGVDIGVLFSDTSEAESDILDCCKDEMWSEAERKEKEELEGLDTFLALKAMGELG